MTATRLHIEGSPADGRLVLSGEIDAHTAPDLDAHLREIDETAELTLDLAAVSFIDSSGLRSIVAAHRTLSDAGGRLILRDPSASVRKILTISGLDAHLHTA